MDISVSDCNISILKSCYSALTVFKVIKVFLPNFDWIQYLVDFNIILHYRPYLFNASDLISIFAKLIFTAQCSEAAYLMFQLLITKCTIRAIRYRQT